jgi:hypothetical protein
MRARSFPLASTVLPEFAALNFWKQDNLGLDGRPPALALDSVSIEAMLCRDQRMSAPEPAI